MRRDVVFGFSMGAILACMVGKRQACRKLILASMTPILDLSRQTLRVLGKQITSDFKKFQYNDLPNSTRTTYIYGDREIDYSLDRIKKTITKTGAKLKIVLNTQHVLNTGYIQQIADEL